MVQCVQKAQPIVITNTHILRTRSHLHCQRSVSVNVSEHMTLQRYHKERTHPGRLADTHSSNEKPELHRQDPPSPTTPRSQTYADSAKNRRPVNKGCELNQRWFACKLVTAIGRFSARTRKHEPKRTSEDLLGERRWSKPGAWHHTATHLIGSSCENVPAGWEEPIMGVKSNERSLRCRVALKYGDISGVRYAKYLG